MLSVNNFHILADNGDLCLNGFQDFVNQLV
jgi:hypothetical protein